MIPHKEHPAPQMNQVLSVNLRRIYSEIETLTSSSLPPKCLLTAFYAISTRIGSRRSKMPKIGCVSAFRLQLLLGKRILLLRVRLVSALLGHWIENSSGNSMFEVLLLIPMVFQTSRRGIFSAGPTSFKSMSRMPTTVSHSHASSDTDWLRQVSSLGYIS